MNNILSSCLVMTCQNALPAAFPEPLPGRLLGIDAGGSATRVVLVADGQVTGGPSRPRLTHC